MDHPLPQYRSWIAVILLAIIICVAFLSYSIRPPANFPETALVSVSDGMTLSQVARTLYINHIIRSPFLFTNIVILFHHERKITDGEYYFERPLSVIDIARRLSSTDYNIDQLKTTIPEGVTISDISQIIKKHYPTFDTVHFITLAKDKEGYLFPDTYYFGSDPQPEKVIDLLTTTFNQKITDPEIDEVIKSSGHPLGDIVKMASILEGEARQMRTRQIVAGILWNRISKGIPLQVDVSFKYINGKTTETLTAADLKIDSPYNTYIHKGFPPTPISNPGIDSILAAATPIKTDYLYFLTDKDGNMHYAKTLEEHVANKRKYLQ